MESGNRPRYNIAGIILLIVIILIVIGVCYWAYTYYTNRKIDSMVLVEVLPDIKDASSKFAVGSGSIPNSKYSNEYSISMWINIHNYSYNYGNEKVILRRGSKANSSLEVVLGANDNDLIVRIQQQGGNKNNMSNISKFENVVNIAKNAQNLKPRVLPDNILMDSLNKISTNKVDYKILQYTCINDDCTPTKISDNSTPPETQVFSNNYFEMVSGNHIIPDTNTTLTRYSNFPEISTTEHFNNPTTTTPITTQSPVTTNTPINTQLPITTQALVNTQQLSNGGMMEDLDGGECVYKMVPLQKWVHVVVSVYNQVVDIYIDGLLASSCILKGFPAISTENVEITPDGGFAGQISRVTFSNTAMTVPKAQSLYNDGPIASSGIFANIPSWVWYAVIFLIIGTIIYSFFM